MKLKISLLSLALCIFPAIIAQTTSKAVVLEMKDGSNVAFLYEELPLMKFTGSDIVIKTISHESSYPQNAVQRYRFSEINAGVNDVVKGSDGQVTLAENDILVRGLEPDTKVTLFAIDGKVLSSGKADNSGKCAINLSSFPAGVFLLNYSNHSVKIVKP